MFCFASLIFLPQGKVWLIDFNPFGEVTDSLLFTWEELSGNNLKDEDSEGAAMEQVREKTDGIILSNTQKRKLSKPSWLL